MPKQAKARYFEGDHIDFKVNDKHKGRVSGTITAIMYSGKDRNWLYELDKSKHWFTESIIDSGMVTIISTGDKDNDDNTEED